VAHKLLVGLFVCFITAYCITFADTDGITVNYNTFHKYKLDSFLLPKESEYNSNIINLKNKINTFKNKINFIDLDFLKNLFKITPYIQEPVFNFPELKDLLKKIKSFNFNNVSINIHFEEFYEGNLNFVIKHQKNNLHSEIYKKSINYTYSDKLFHCTLKKGLYKFQIYDNNLLIAESKILRVTNFDEKIVYMKVLGRKNLTFKLLCNDKKSPLNESIVALKYSDGSIYITGLTQKNGIVIWGNSKKEKISLPIMYNPDDYLLIDIKNQRQKIKPEKIHIDKNLTSNKIMDIVTDQYPKKYYKDKSVTVKGKIISDIVSSRLGLPFIKVVLYEKEVGFLDLYSNDAVFLKIGEAYTYSDGSFEIKNVLMDDGPQQITRDIIVALELDSDYLVMYNAMLGTKIIYKFKKDYQENLWPYKNEYNFGEIHLDSKSTEKSIKLFNMVENELIKLRKSDPIFNQKLYIIYPSTKIHMESDENIRFFYSDNLLKVTKTGGNYLLKYGLTSDNIKDLLKEAAKKKRY
jgi:hypothetical protein